MDELQAKSLLNRYLEGNCSPEEAALVEKWYQRLEQTGDLSTDSSDIAHYGQLIEAQLRAKTGKAPVVSINRSKSGKWKIGYAAAAIVLLFLAARFFMDTKPPANTVVKAEMADSILAPEAVRATITLANGQKVYLDSAVAGDLASLGDVRLVRLPSGEIVYQVSPGAANSNISYNKLDNPRGSKVATIILADGTKVWLNAESSLTYPVVFTGKDRRVTITGEAYFEVAHNPAKPFFVVSKNSETEVLGTHFNVNAYDDEGETKVTLVEGSVKVHLGQNTGLLKPGQQAKVGNTIQVENDADVEQAVAWKNGYFHFRGTSLEQVMQEVGRWYDMDIVFRGAKPKRQFGGEISRSSTLGQVLKILEESEVRFTVSGKQIVVEP